MPTWIGSTSGNWLDSANWTGGVPNGVGAEAIFNIADNGSTTTIHNPGSSATISTLSANITGTNNLIFTGVGNDLILVGDSSGAPRITVNNSAATGIFEISNGGGFWLRLDHYAYFEVTNATGFARISTPIYGNGGIVKTGAGTLEITADNYASGLVQGFSIFEGTLVAASDLSLGSGAVLIGYNAQFRSQGIINNEILLGGLGDAVADSGKILTGAGQTLTLTGYLRHEGIGTLTFGSTTDTGTIIVSSTFLPENAVNQSHTLAGGTLRIGNAYSGANLLVHPGNGATTIASGATLDTNGFNTSISNLVTSAGATILSSSGALLVTATVAAGYNSAATFVGTASGDWIQVTGQGLIELGGWNLSGWGSGDLVTVYASNGDDTVSGTTGNDDIFGYDGNDNLAGGGGQDFIRGGGGIDLIQINSANSGSLIDGGTGFDTLRLSGGSVSLIGLNGIESLYLDTATLQLTGAQFGNGLAVNADLGGTGTIVVNMTPGITFLAKAMNLQPGSTIAFEINGTSVTDVIKLHAGTAGTIDAADGHDIVQGSNLTDTIAGSGGIDKIAGNGGADVLSGGSGADVFKYRRLTDSGTGAAEDWIIDFVSGTDRLNFVRIDTNAVLAGDQAFTYIGTASFSVNGTAQIRWTDLGTDLRVEADVNGDGLADMSILLHGAGAQVLTAADFVL